MERHLAKPIIDQESGEVLYDVVTPLDESKLKKMIEEGIETIEIINDLAEGADMSIINAFIADSESLRLLKQTEQIDDENILSKLDKNIVINKNDSLYNDEEIFKIGKITSNYILLKDRQGRVQTVYFSSEDNK